MFPDTAKDFHNKQLRSTQKFISIFVKQKGLMENKIGNLGMAYFEYFYMQQLKDGEIIKKFKEKYPNVGSSAKKLRKLYGLSKAKKSMREGLVCPKIALKLQFKDITHYTNS